jgi:hypothetical protein
MASMDCRYYDNDKVMAALGRQVIDMYIGMSTTQGWTDKDRSELRGPASFIIAAIGEKVNEDGEEETVRYDCADCIYHAHTTERGPCICGQEWDEHNTCCKEMGSDHLDDAKKTCSAFMTQDEYDNQDDE